MTGWYGGLELHFFVVVSTLGMMEHATGCRLRLFPPFESLPKLQEVVITNRNSDRHHSWYSTVLGPYRILCSSIIVLVLY
jgi:hypothetical protein